MNKTSKRMTAAKKDLDREKLYPLEEAVTLVKNGATAKFDETVEVAMRLGVDPRHADQMVRGVVSLPHGTGKTVRVAVFAKADKADEAKKVPSGENLTLRTMSVCPWNICKSFPVLVSHKPIDLSPPAEARSLLLGEKLTPKDITSWPFGFFRGLSVAISHIRTVLSQLPEKRNLLLLEN